MNESITLRQAAERLGVHYMTAYRYVRLGLLAARKDGRTWLIDSSDLERFQQGNASPASPSLSRRNVAWHERLHNRLVAGDQSGAWKVVEMALASGATPSRVYVDMLAPALVSIAHQAEKGEIGLAQERQGSVIVGRIVGRLGPRFEARGRRKGLVVVTAPAGDTHSLGLSMVSDILRVGGYVVADLGPDLPAEELGAFLGIQERLQGLCLGLSNPAAGEAAKESIRVARPYLRSVPIVVGGAAVVSDAEAHALGADRHADLAGVVEAVEAGRETQAGVHI